MVTDVPIFPIEEAESGQCTALITGNAETILPGSTLSTLKLTVYAIDSDGVDHIINGRNQQNVLNVNNVTVADVATTRPDGTQYNLVWTIQPGDTVILNDALRNERHICLFEWTWPTGNAGKQEIILSVRNLRRVP